MNACNRTFIEKNRIDLSKIDTKIYTREDINWIVEKYGIIGKTYDTQISMEDLVGIDIGKDMKPHFPDILDSFFGETDGIKDLYKTRSIELLEYDENNILEGLRISFYGQKINVVNIDGGKSVIGSNGHHRFLVLRLLYLHAKSKCSDDQQSEVLKHRFSIPVTMSNYDLLKTYCKYLINIFQPASIVDVHITNIFKGRKLPFHKQRYDAFIKGEIITDSNGKKKIEEKRIEISEEEYQDYMESANSINSSLNGDSVTIKFLDGREMSLSDEELIEYTRGIIKNSKHKKRILKDKSEHSFRNALEQYESFKNFIAMNFGEEILSFESKRK